MEDRVGFSNTSIFLSAVWVDCKSGGVDVRRGPIAAVTCLMYGLVFVTNVIFCRTLLIGPLETISSSSAMNRLLCIRAAADAGVRVLVVRPGELL